MTSETSLTTQTESAVPENPVEDTPDSLAPVESKYDPNKFSEEQREERRNKVWEMRIIDRLPMREIAKRLDVSVFTVHADVKAIETQRVKTLKEKDMAFVARQDEIYEALITKWLPVALNPDAHQILAPDGETIIWSDDPALKATDRIARVLAEQAKLHGFGGGGKDVSAKEVGKEIGIHVMEAMTKLAHGQLKQPVIEGELVTKQIEDAKPDS